MVQISSITGSNCRGFACQSPLQMGVDERRPYKDCNHVLNHAQFRTILRTGMPALFIPVSGRNYLVVYKTNHTGLEYAI